MIPFLPKSRPAFHFLTVATFNSEAPAASPSHCPHAGLTSLQPTPLTTGSAGPRLQAATPFHCAWAQRHAPSVGEGRAEVSARSEFLSFLSNFLLVVSFPV